jgi:outer membrane lipoprotein-sorting protein
MLAGIALLMFSCICNITHGQEDLVAMENIEAFKHNIKKASAETLSISSEFIQKKHLDFLEEDVESKGKFYFKKEDQLRWEYSTPFFYLIIFSGDSVIISNDEKTNTFDASSGRMFKEISNIMVSMVDGSILDSDRFTCTYFENPDTYLLELIPQDVNMKAFLSKVRIFISKSDYTAEELFMVESSGDYTHIHFINKRLNEKIPDHIFELP